MSSGELVRLGVSLSPRHRRILEHVAAYRVSLRSVMESTLFGGRGMRKDLAALCAAGLLCSRRQLSGSRSYYQLSHRGAQALGLSSYWARPMGMQSLVTNLGLLWFCCMGEYPRRRLTAASYTAFFQGERPAGHHCVEKRGEEYRLYRVFIPMPGTPRRSIIASVKSAIEAALDDPARESLVRERRFVFAVLVSHADRKRSLFDSLRRTELDTEGVPLLARVKCSVELVPDFFSGTANTRRPRNVRMEEETIASQHDAGDDEVAR
ncbi:MAG: hypothetical protein QY326_03270 [Bdellovibrionota bacterium]|nr:MAG: hypothetical protein QY326_03270 [Bdellovibrionota bacterium]